MSLASIKQKEAKGRKNALPKLRTVLANPYKHQHSPVLPDDELLELQQILKTAISQSGLPRNSFATHAHFQLGLESSLRAINARRFSCVFISLSIKPSHLIRLVATSAAVKVPTAPIYALPKLEELTNELFGVRALALVLPLDLNGIDLDLAKWVAARKKMLRASVPLNVKPAKKRKQLEQVPEIQPLVNALQDAASAVPKQWSGDYISCLKDDTVIQLDQIDKQAETQKLDAALSKLAMKANIATKPTAIFQPSAERMELEEESTHDIADMDEFLPMDVYRPLTVHQIQPNPRKKPKKKRNKKQQQPNKTA